MHSILRRIKGAVGTAAIWAGTWFGVSFGLSAALVLSGSMGPMPGLWSLLLLAAAQTGLSGFVTGLLFSAYLRATHQGDSVLSIGVGRSALAGAVVAGLWSLATTGLWMLATGFAFSPALLFISVAPPMVLGAITAAGSVAAARWGEAHALELEKRKALGLTGE